MMYDGLDWASLTRRQKLAIQLSHLQLVIQPYLGGIYVIEPLLPILYIPVSLTQLQPPRLYPYYPRTTPRAPIVANRGNLGCFSDL